MELEESDVKAYADFPKEIRERRKKQWPKLKKAREEGKSDFFSKPDPDNVIYRWQLCCIIILQIFANFFLAVLKTKVIMIHFLFTFLC